MEFVIMKTLAALLLLITTPALALTEKFEREDRLTGDVATGFALYSNDDKAALIFGCSDSQGFFVSFLQEEFLGSFSDGPYRAAYDARNTLYSEFRVANRDIQRGNWLEPHPEGFGGWFDITRSFARRVYSAAPYEEVVFRIWDYSGVAHTHVFALDEFHEIYDQMIGCFPLKRETATIPTPKAKPQGATQF